MIRHDDITADSDAVLVVSAVRETDKRLMNRIRREQCSSLLRAGRHEEDGIGGKKQMKPRRNLGILAHRGVEKFGKRRVRKQRRPRASHREAATEDGGARQRAEIVAYCGISFTSISRMK